VLIVKGAKRDHVRPHDTTAADRGGRGGFPNVARRGAVEAAAGDGDIVVGVAALAVPVPQGGGLGGGSRGGSRRCAVHDDAFGVVDESSRRGCIS
jgi:hypothetical protein